jgi:hypothetical protein
MIPKASLVIEQHDDNDNTATSFPQTSNFNDLDLEDLHNVTTAPVTPIHLLPPLPIVKAVAEMTGIVIDHIDDDNDDTTTTKSKANTNRRSKVVMRYCILITLLIIAAALIAILVSMNVHSNSNGNRNSNGNNRTATITDGRPSLFTDDGRQGSLQSSSSSSSSSSPPPPQPFRDGGKGGGR